MRRISTLLVGLVLACAPAAGQTPSWDATGLQLTRAELEELLERFEAMANMEAYSGDLRRQAEAEAAIVRERLEQGDLRVGDRVVLEVEGHQELTDTLMVVTDRVIVLQGIGPVPLQGVLRSELQDHLTEYIGRYIRQPIVRARSLVRLEIAGAVGRAGFYTVPSDILLSDALMLAGGPQNANLDRMRIERGDDVIWTSERLSDALVEGRTLDQLSVRAGDTIRVPERSSTWDRARNLLLVLSSVASALVLAKQVGLF